MGKYVKELIGKIERMTAIELPSLVQYGNTREYQCKRQELNKLIISAAFGAEIKEGDKEKIKFNHSMPSIEELKKICDLLDNYIRLYESRIFTAEDDDDMGDPMSNNMLMVQNVSYNSKVSTKNVRNFISGNSGPAVILNYLNGKDVMELAAVGQELRKKQNITKTIIIGGITIAIVAGVITGICIYNHKKKEDDEAYMDDVNDSVDAANADIVDVDDAVVVDF